MNTRYSEGVPFSSRVGGQYYDLASDRHEVVNIHDPSLSNYLPKPRFDHCASLIDRKWYVYGGEGCSAAFIDVYDPPEEKWVQHITKGDIPPASSSVACATVNNKFYTFGGRTSGGKDKYTNALCELDIDAMCWRNLKLDNPMQAPLPKRNAVMVANDGLLVTFGGYGIIPSGMQRSKKSYDKDNKKAEVWTNELIYCDLSKNMWVSPKVDGVPPKPCSECTLTKVGQNRVVLLGGIGIGGKCSHDFKRIKILDMSSTSVWNWISVDAHCTQPFPLPRYGHCAVSLHELTHSSSESSLLMLWGSGNEDKWIDNGWMLTMKECSNHYEWNKVEFPSKYLKPAFKCTIELATNSRNKQLIRFGGMINDKLNPMDDTSILDIATGDKGKIEIITYRIPRPNFDSQPTVKRECLTVDADYPGLKFFNQTQCKEVMSSDVEQEIDMGDIGVKFSIPAGAISENKRDELLVHPVACGNVEMPTDFTSHSPLYIIKPVQMEKEVKIHVEHNCNLESEEDCESMVFFGIDPNSQPDGTYKLKEIAGARTSFKRGVQVGEIFLKELQSLKIGRKCAPNETGEKRMYSALFFSNPSPTMPGIAAVFSICQLQSTYIKCVEKLVKMDHPEFEKKWIHPVYFAEDEVKLVADKNMDIDKNVIYREEVDLPDKMDVQEIDYPPFITIRALRNSNPQSNDDKEPCKLEILGLTRDISFKMSLNTPSTQHEAFVDLYPPSPPLMSSDLLSPNEHSTGTLMACGRCCSLQDGICINEKSNLTPPTTPKCYSDDTELKCDDLRIICNALREIVIHWEHIGLNLNIEYHELQVIEKSGGDSFHHFLCMLHKWISEKSSFPKTVKSLRSALKETDSEYYASQLLDRLNLGKEKLKVNGSERIKDDDDKDCTVNLQLDCEDSSIDFENPEKRRLEFETSIDQAAKDLQNFTENWKENDVLRMAKHIAFLIGNIQHSLREAYLPDVLKKIRKECHDLTQHKSLKMLTTKNKYESGRQLKMIISRVESLSLQLSYAKSQLKKSHGTEEESMEFLLQNVQSLSKTIQSLLKATEAACLETHVVDISLSWTIIDKDTSRRTVSLSRRKELEKSLIMSAGYRSRVQSEKR